MTAEVSTATCDAKHDGIERDIKDIKADILRLWDKVDRPSWAMAWTITTIVGLLLAVIGFMAKGLIS